MLTSGRTKSVQDAPTTNDHDCREAKPSECPKGDRDNKSEVYFKNRLFQQTEFIYLNLSKNQYIFENGVWGEAPSGVRAAAPHSAPSQWEGVWG